MQFLKKTKTKTLVAVCDGESQPITVIPDEAFSSGMLGAGYAIEPGNGRFVSPIDGTITSVAATGHAYTILDGDGLDILVHIGVDTVQMGGKGFTPQVKEGQRVRAGEPIAKVDLSLIREKELPTVTAVLITNPEQAGALEYRFGQCTAGKDAVMQCLGARKGN